MPPPPIPYTPTKQQKQTLVQLCLLVSSSSTHPIHTNRTTESDSTLSFLLSKLNSVCRFSSSREGVWCLPCSREIVAQRMSCSYRLTVREQKLLKDTVWYTSLSLNNFPTRLLIFLFTLSSYGLLYFFFVYWLTNFN